MTTELSTAPVTTTMKKMPDFQRTSFHGRIAHMEVVPYEDREFLSVTLAHTVSEQMDVRIKFTNSNGLLTAFRNGTVVIGQELLVDGNIKGIRCFYMKNDLLTPLKYPEIQLRCAGYVFGSKPQPKAEVTADQIPVAAGVDVPFSQEPTAEEIEF